MASLSGIADVMARMVSQVAFDMELGGYAVLVLDRTGENFAVQYFTDLGEGAIKRAFASAGEDNDKTD